MDVELAEERILVLADRFNLDQPKAWAKRTDAFGTVAKLGGLLNRRVRQAGGDTFEQYLGKVLEPKFLLDAGV